MRRIHGLFFIIYLSFCACACNKVKQENTLPELPQQNAPNSAIRLYNFYGDGLDLRVNNFLLTNFDSTGTNPTTPTAVGAAYFPTGKWTTSGSGSPFTIPTSMLDKDGKAHIQIRYRGPTFPWHYGYIDTTLQSDPLHPADFFVLYTGVLLRLPHSTVTPANPSNFKIRVMNFGMPTDTLNLGGSATVTYSDGTPVAGALSHIGPDNTSDYVELPFGSYQFKVFMDDDHSKQLAGPGTFPTYACYDPNMPPQEGLFPFILTFRPGYTYTIIVTPTIANFFCDPIPNYVVVNQYHIITDNSANPNNTLALLQAVNALPSSTVQFTIDGSPVAHPLDYTKTTPDFNPVVVGPHTIGAYDAEGKLLAEGTYNFSAYDYITAWVFEKDGKPGLTFSPNDMTSSAYLPINNDDGTDGSLNVTKYPIAWQCRFLNLSADMPYATFTNDLLFFTDITTIGAPVASNATVNLGQGMVPDRDWNIIIPISFNSMREMVPQNLPASIRVNQSSPGPPVIAPGSLRYDINALYMKDFISNPGLYTNGYLPLVEPGIYTVALMGRTAADAAPSEKAKLMIVKHFK